MPYGYNITPPTDTRPNTATVINIAHVTRVLAEYDKRRNKSFKGGTSAPDEYFTMLLGMETEILEWLYTYQSDYAYMTRNTNYVWSLIGNYAGAALRALGNGNGIVINPTTGAPIGIDRYREDFAIGGIGGLPLPRYSFADGAISYTVPLSGFVIAFLEPSGVDEMIGDDTQASLTSIDYTANYVRFNLNQPVRDGEKYIVWGLRVGNVTGVTGGSGVPIPLPLEEGKFLTNDGDNLLWGDPFVEITSADFESDGVTYLNSELEHHTFAIFFDDANTWLKPEEPEVEFTRISGGGFIINLTDFDANSNDYHFKIFKKGIDA